MSWELKNKVAVIAGGGGGIGSAIADHFSEEDVKTIILLDLDSEKANEVVKTLNAKYKTCKIDFMRCDVKTDIDEVTKKIVSDYGYVDVLVNGYGVVDETDAGKMMETNATATINWSLKYLDLMRKDLGGKGGTIINISSIYGFRVCSFAPIYTASKFAIMGFSKALGHCNNFKKTGVRVLTICPGYTNTGMLTNPKLRDQASEDDKNNLLEDASFVVQDPDEVGKAAAEVFRRAESGTVWLIEHAGPVVQLL